MRISKNVSIIEHYDGIEIKVWCEATHRTKSVKVSFEDFEKIALAMRGESSSWN